MARLNQFCFSSGAAIHEEDGAARCGTSGKPADKVGARRPETQRAAPVWPNSSGLWLDRMPDTAFAKSLDLEPNQLRQNGSI
ncbi:MULTISPECIES: hypothetical protein [Chelativorans]|jgi:hypothetical protein|uniref:Uncharacterized protein n=1 Tax=Chelativorans sp. (strain BNC1) TaxID=266779 RepID=Q11IR3_CHESB|nr:MULTISPECIES: hypothetical protein [Chelativorans]